MARARLDPILPRAFPNVQSEIKFKKFPFYFLLITTAAAVAAAAKFKCHEEARGGIDLIKGAFLVCKSHSRMSYEITPCLSKHLSFY